MINKELKNKEIIKKAIELLKLDSNIFNFSKIGRVNKTICIYSKNKNNYLVIKNFCYVQYGNLYKNGERKKLLESYDL